MIPDHTGQALQLSESLEYLGSAQAELAQFNQLPATGSMASFTPGDRGNLVKYANVTHLESFIIFYFVRCLRGRTVVCYPNTKLILLKICCNKCNDSPKQTSLMYH